LCRVRRLWQANGGVITLSRSETRGRPLIGLDLPYGFYNRAEHHLQSVL
jgi:hypothetical protein